MRALFIARAAAELGADSKSIDVRDGPFCIEGAPTSLDYWSLTGRFDLRRNATGAGGSRPGTGSPMGASGTVYAYKSEGALILS